MTHNQRAKVFKRSCGVVFVITLLLSLATHMNYSMHSNIDSSWTLVDSIYAVIVGTGWLCLILACVASVFWLISWFFDIKLFR